MGSARYRVIQWATGAVGTHALRALIGDPLFELAGDPPTGRGGLLATAMRVVNAIPAVCDAPPGLVTSLDLPIAPRRALVRP